MADGSDYAHITRTDPSAALRTELVWPGKRTQVERVALPFQVVETVKGR